MPKKRNTASESILNGGAAPARTRKHAPAKRNADPVVESSPSTDSIPAATLAENTSTHSLITEAPTFDEIARLAYSYWEARGYQGGSSEEDWLRAEQELRGTLANAAQA